MGLNLAPAAEMSKAHCPGVIKKTVVSFVFQVVIKTNSQVNAAYSKHDSAFLEFALERNVLYFEGV